MQIQGEQVRRELDAELSAQALEQVLHEAEGDLQHLYKYSKKLRDNLFRALEVGFACVFTAADGMGVMHVDCNCVVGT